MTLTKIFPGRVSLQEGALLLSLISLLGLQMDNFAGDPGVGWHLATGKWIAQHGAVPKVDPFLASTVARPWVSDQWLADYLFNQLFQLGSWPLLYAVLTAVYLVTYFLFLHGGLKHLGTGALAATAGTLVAFKAGQIHFILRPVLFSFLFFAAVFVWVLAAERSREPPARVAWLILPAAFMLWANLHPGFVLGLFLMGALAVSVFLRRVCEISIWGPYVGLALVCGLATVINPQFFELHRSILALQQSSYFMQLHEEWRPIQPGTPEGDLFIAALILVALGAVFGKGERRAGGDFPLLMFLAFAWWTLNAVRMVPFFGIVAAYPVACSLQSLGRTLPFQRLRSFRRLKEAFTFFEEREGRSRGTGGLLAIGVLVLLFSSITFGNLILFRGPFGPKESKFPYAAVAELLKRRGDAGGAPWTVAAGAEWGGFIAFWGQGQLKPLIDDRNTMLGEEFYRRYEEHVENGKNWEEFLNAQSADVVLLQPERPLIKAFRAAPSSGWDVVFTDEVATALLREMP